MTQRSMPSTKRLLLLAARAILIASLDDANLLAAQDPPAPFIIHSEPKTVPEITFVDARSKPTTPHPLVRYFTRAAIARMRRTRTRMPIRPMPPTIIHPIPSIMSCTPFVPYPPQSGANPLSAHLIQRMPFRKEVTGRSTH